MKNLSIRTRVTLFYAVVIIFLILTAFTIFFTTADYHTEIVSKETLSKVVQDSFDNVEYENNIIEIDNDFDSYSRGVILIVYNQDGTLLKGTVPNHFPSSTPLSSGEFNNISENDCTWLSYDILNTYENGQGIWVRGIYAYDNEIATLESIKKIMLIIIPILIFLIIFAGYRITKKAFVPITEITASAKEINNGHDLSLRLPLGEKKDELYYLTDTLNNMLYRLETAFNSEKAFNSDVSHELKTPIAVILAECEYTLKENHTEEEYKESLESIQLQCKRTMSLIQQLLQISRTINKDLSLEIETFDLSFLCDTTADQLIKTAASNNIDLKKDIQPNIIINADETLIMRMLLNLLSNGIKYGKKDGTGYVKISVEQKDQIKITVEDNGIGIDDKNQKLIFNRFFKVDKSRKSEENSYGLGLAMVKWIVDAHNGQINLESSLNKGSKFTVTL